MPLVSTVLAALFTCGLFYWATEPQLSSISFALTGKELKIVKFIQDSTIQGAISFHEYAVPSISQSGLMTQSYNFGDKFD